MLEASLPAAAAAIANECTPVRRSARLCRGNFGRVCRALWPEKTAEHLAAATRSAVRTAAYKLSGEREPTARDIAAVLNEMLT